MLTDSLDLLITSLDRNEDLDAKVITLEAEIATLKAALVASQKNSSNSSKPPSSDIVKPPKGKRKIGAQKGHKKHNRISFSEAQLDLIHNLTLDSCPRCNGTLYTAIEKRIAQQSKSASRVFYFSRFLSVSQPAYFGSFVMSFFRHLRKS